MVGLRVILHYYMDRRCLCELNGVEKFVLGALQVEILNVHVFTHTQGLVY